MIAMVEGAARKKTPNEIALEIFLVALSIVFILVTLALYCYSCFSVGLNDMDNPTAVTTLVALLVCLAPTTIGALLSAIGIAGMSRLNQANVLAMSGRAIEAAGDVDILMLDKTGTITLATAKPPSSSRSTVIDPANWPMPPSFPLWPMKPPKAVPLSCSQRSSSVCVAAHSRIRIWTSSPLLPRPA